MSELIVESVNETVVIIEGGPTLTTTVGGEIETIVQEWTEPIIIDLNAGPPGQPGAAILTGPHPPSGAVGVMGDLYIVTQGTVLVGEVFRKTGSTTWTNEGNVRGPAGGVNSVNAKTGPDVILTKDDLGLANVTNDAQVALSGAQTITGAKTFTTAPIVPDDSFAISKVNGLQAALEASGSDATVVHLAGAETITGAKTFSVAPVVPDSSFTIAKVTNLQASLNAKEGTIAAGTTAQYWRGDKSWQTLDKNAVGLANVDNTSDANKPVSSATQTALNAKEPSIAAGTTGQYWRGDKTWVVLDKSAVGLSNVVNAAQVELAGDQTVAGIKTFSSSPVVPTPTLVGQAANKGYVDSTVNALIAAAPGALDTLDELAAALGDDPNFATTMTNQLALKAPLASPTFTGTVSGITKSMVGLGNVDNTSDVNKPVSTATQTALNAKEPTIAAGTTAQYWRGDKSWQTLNASAVGLGNVANLAQVDLVNAQTIGGVKTFTATPVFQSGMTVTGTVTATAFSGSGASLSALNGSNISSGTVGQARIIPNIVRVEHGSNAATSRPTGATYVDWIGSVTPTGMTTGDTFSSTAASGGNPELYPSGMVSACAIASSTAPSGWYFCEGQQILISGDTTLYNALTNNGTVFPYGANTNGAGAAGTTYFRLPDLRGRVIAHLDGTTEFASIGTVFGAKSVTLTSAQIPAHTHPIADSGHTHPIYYFTSGNEAGGYGLIANGGFVDRVLVAGGTTNSGSSITGVTVQNNTGGGGSHNNIQPTMALRYMVKR